MDPEKRRWLELEHWRDCDTEHWDRLALMPKWKILEICWASLDLRPEIGLDDMEVHDENGKVLYKIDQHADFDFRVEYLQRYFNVADPAAYVDFEEAKQALIDLSKREQIYLPNGWRPVVPNSQSDSAKRNTLSPAERGRMGGTKRHNRTHALREGALKIFEAEGGGAKFRSARQAAQKIAKQVNAYATQNKLTPLAPSNAELTIADWIRKAYPSLYGRKKSKM